MPRWDYRLCTRFQFYQKNFFFTFRNFQMTSDLKYTNVSLILTFFLKILFSPFELICRVGSKLKASVLPLLSDNNVLFDRNKFTHKSRYFMNKQQSVEQMTETWKTKATKLCFNIRQPFLIEIPFLFSYLHFCFSDFCGTCVFMVKEDMIDINEQEKKQKKNFLVEKQCESKMCSVLFLRLTCSLKFLLCKRFQVRDNN